MIGNLIARIREEKKITKTDLAKETNINVGHLTHIEKEERNPSHKTLKILCDALDVPYQQLMYTYDFNLNEEQLSYKAYDHIIYDSIPVIGSIYGFAKCPKEMNSATFVLKVFDDSMSPKFSINDFVYIQVNAPLNSKDIGLFKYNDQIIFRKFIVRKNDIVLRAEKDGVADIILSKNDNFSIVGKVLGIVEK